MLTWHRAYIYGEQQKAVAAAKTASIQEESLCGAAGLINVIAVLLRGPGDAKTVLLVSVNQQHPQITIAKG